MEIPAGHARVPVHMAEYGLGTGIESDQIEALVDNNEAFDSH
jgi:hypothetical protein